MLLARPPDMVRALQFHSGSTLYTLVCPQKTLGKKLQFQGSEMSPGLFQNFMVFVPGVTESNEDVGSVQDHIFVPGITQGNKGMWSVQDFILVYFLV